jgi:hypothetical protein
VFSENCRRKAERRTKSDIIPLMTIEEHNSVLESCSRAGQSSQCHRVPRRTRGFLCRVRTALASQRVSESL